MVGKVITSKTAALQVKFTAVGGLVGGDGRQLQLFVLVDICILELINWNTDFFFS